MAQTRTLYSRRWWLHVWRTGSDGLALLIDVLFVASGLFLLFWGDSQDLWKSLGITVFFGLCGAVMVPGVRQRWPRLELTPHGFSALVGGQERFFHWHEVSRFEVNSLRFRSRVRFAHTPAIGSGHDPWQDPWLDAVGQLELAEGYGQRPEVLCDLLNSWRDRHGGSPS